MPQEQEIDIDHLAHLCRIKCTEEEKKALHQNLKKILNYVAYLDEIDTDQVKPCMYILEVTESVMAEDVEGERLDREEFLHTTPSHVGGMVKIPTVIQYEE